MLSRLGSGRRGVQCLQLISVAEDDQLIVHGNPRFRLRIELHVAGRPLNRHDNHAELLAQVRVLDRLAHQPRASGDGDLLRRNGTAWLGPLLGLCDNYEYRRGFIEVATLTLNRLLQHGDTLFRHAPIRELRVAMASWPVIGPRRAT